MRRWTIAGGVALTILGGSSSGALAGAADPASCMGKLGSNEPSAGARAEDAHAIQELAGEIGIPPGVISSGFARQDVCEE
jgi:hypothetical protein